MTTFDKRKQALENAHFRKQDLGFITKARARKFLGLWAAQRIGKSEEESLQYALEIIGMDVTENDNSAVVEKVYNDIKEASVDISKERVKEKLSSFYEIAEQQVKKQTSE